MSGFVEIWCRRRAQQLRRAAGRLFDRGAEKYAKALALDARADAIVRAREARKGPDPAGAAVAERAPRA